MGTTLSVPEPSDLPLAAREAVLGGRSRSLEGVAQLIKQGRARKIVCLCGAGISVSAGIPDFRTPGTWLYSQLEKFGLGDSRIMSSWKFWCGFWYISRRFASA